MTGIKDANGSTTTYVYDAEGRRRKTTRTDGRVSTNEYDSCDMLIFATDYSLHKYLYANGNPVKYNDPSGNMFDLSSTTMGMGIQSILNNAVQICYRGVISGLINMTLTAVMGGSFEDAMSSFVTGFVLGAGISAIRYFVVGAELVTLARFYVLSASANFIFSTTMTIFAITQGYSELAVMSGVMVVLSIAEWCWAYGNYLRIDVYGNKGCATIECDPSSGSGNLHLSNNNIKHIDKHTFEGMKAQSAYVDDVTLEKMLEGNTFFNKNWSQDQIINNVEIAYNDLLNQGKTGLQVYEIDGEIIYLFLKENGMFDTAYGIYTYTVQDFR